MPYLFPKIKFLKHVIYGLITVVLVEDSFSIESKQPVIVKHPEDAISHVGGNVLFEVVTKDHGSYKYQWRFNGSNLVAQNSAKLNLNGLTEESSGSYSVTVSNETGMTVSRSANLCITPTEGGPVTYGFSPRFPIPNGMNFMDTMYENDRYYCVGGNGLLISSTDAVQWHMEDSTVGVNLNSITSGNGILVAVGDEGCVITSTDGIHWWRRISGSREPLRGVEFGNGKFIAVGMAGTILSSADGIHWNSDSGATLESWNGIAFGNSRFVIVGSGGIIKTSEDGSSWTTQASGISSDLMGIYFRDSRFIAMGTSGNILISADAKSWSAKLINKNVISQPDLVCGGYGDNVDLMFGKYGDYWLSYDDGTNWIQAPSLSSESVRSIVYGKSGYVAVGKNSIFSSNDAIDWTLRGEQLESIGQTFVGENFTEKDGFYYLISSGWNLSRSTNIFEWNTVPIKKPISSFAPSGIAYGNGKLVAFGASMYIGEGIFSSENGLEWENSRPRPSDDLAFEGVYNEFFGGGRFVFSGYDGQMNELILSSADGDTWEKCSFSSERGFIKSIAYGNNVFVAASSGGRIYSSLDSLKWNRRLTGTTADIEGVVFFKNKFFAVCKSRDLLISQDGVAWNLLAAPWSSVKTSLDSSNGTIAATEDCLFVVASNGAKYLSQDGNEWRKIHSNNDTSSSRAIKAIGNRIFSTMGYNLCHGVARPLIKDPKIKISGPLGSMHSFQAIDFSKTRVGEFTKIDLLIENSGESNLRGLTYILTGKHADDFKVNGLDDPILLPNGKVNISIEFKRDTKAARWADLKIISSDPEQSIFVIPLICSVLKEPDISICQPLDKKLVDGKSTRNFGVVKKGKSAKRVFSIKNSGNSELDQVSVFMRGDDVNDFSIKYSQNRAIDPGKSSSFDVTFKPKAKGLRRTTLFVKSNDPDESPFEIRIIGEGG